MSDEAYIERAIELARRGSGLVSPNPMVGAVVVSDGAIVGEGFHEGPGLPHAEIMALNHAGERARGATLYTSLEPCDHYGRTPPCTEAIVRAGIARVVSATRDPNPVVDGQGVRTLRARGVEVREGVLADEADRLNEAFAKHVRTGMPFVIWKAAASLDGKVAARDGSSRWITGEAARADVHRLRAWADAIVVGAGTALADDPELTVRDPDYRGRPPIRVLVDARGRVGPSGDLFDDQAPTLVATTELAPAAARDAWRDAGAEVLVVEHDDVGRGADRADGRSRQARRPGRAPGGRADARVVGGRGAPGRHDRPVPVAEADRRERRPDRVGGAWVRARSGTRCRCGSARWNGSART